MTLINQRFLRNLVEYGRDLKVCSDDHENGGVNDDFNLLTVLLHEKSETANMRFSDLKNIYKVYLGIDEFESDVDPGKQIITALYEICDCLTEDSTELAKERIRRAAKTTTKRQPLRAVFRDSSFVGSPAKINVTQIFKEPEPDTSVKVL